MKKVLAFIALACLGSAIAMAQQKSTTLNLAAIDKPNVWKTINVIANPVERDGKEGAFLRSLADSANGIVGMALPVGVEFETGVIELDLQGKNERGRSFLGVVFNVSDDKTFEAIYFRPFNFKADPPFRERAVQYISWPSSTWEKLRSNHPGQYENAIKPAPNPDGWFHARIDVRQDQVRVCVNDASEPSLVVDHLTASKGRRPVGLFVDSADGLYANATITAER